MPTLAYYDEGGVGLRAMIAVSDVADKNSIGIHIQYNDGVPCEALSIVVPNAREFLGPIMEWLEAQA